MNRKFDFKVLKQDDILFLDDYRILTVLSNNYAIDENDKLLKIKNIECDVYKIKRKGITLAKRKFNNNTSYKHSLMINEYWKSREKSKQINLKESLEAIRNRNVNMEVVQ